MNELPLGKLADGLLQAILWAEERNDLRELSNAVGDLTGVLDRIHPDLSLEFDHLIGFKEEKLGLTSFTTPSTAVDAQYDNGVSYIRRMLAAR